MGNLEKFKKVEAFIPVMTKRGQAVISIPDGVSRILGFIIGYLFSSEVISAVVFMFGYAKRQIPTLFDLLSKYNTTVATILLALLIIFLLGLVSRFHLLSFAVWILYGALLGLVLPMIMPYILQRLHSSGYDIPDFIKKMLKVTSGGISNGNNSTA